MRVILASISLDLKSENGFQGPWDNYQCKRYAQPLRPSDIWVEIGKIIYYSHRKEFIAPDTHYFVCSQGVGTTLEKLLNNTEKLKEQARSNWEKYCKTEITSTADVPLDGELLKYFDAFDFSIFSSKSIVELIDAHALTAHHAVRFGGGLPPRPPTGAPPATPADEESRYIRHILDAYGEHLGKAITAPDSLVPHDNLNKDFLRQREDFTTRKRFAISHVIRCQTAPSPRFRTKFIMVSSISMKVHTPVASTG